MTKPEDCDEGFASNRILLTRQSLGEGRIRSEEETPGREEGVNVLCEDTECGYFGWRPRWLQKCHTPKFALALMCWFCTMQGFIENGSIPVSVQMIERRYNLDSTQLGFISSFYDITIAVLAIPIGYYALSWHQPRALAVSCLSLGLGSFIMALPHFVYGEYQLATEAPGSSLGNVCRVNSTGDVCDDTNNIHRSAVVYIFLLGQVCNGIGGLALFSIGIVYIDENVNKHTSPMYLGIFSFFACVGPSIAFIFGGKMLDTYVDIGRIDTNKVSITPEDPRWVGAWWISFLIGSILTFFCGAMIFCLGRRLPGAPAKSVKTVTSDDGDVFILRKGQTLRDLPGHTLALMMNHTFVLLLLSLTATSVTLNGIESFFVKFVQNQFNLEASSASMLTGVIMIPSAAAAHLTGGYLVKRFRMGIPGMVRLSLVFMAIASLLSAILLLRCDLPNMPGINQPYDNITRVSDISNLKANCNAQCNCSTLERQPVCGIDNREYFSPCHAGCLSYEGMEKNKNNYGNCSCIMEYLGSEVNTSDIMATEGKCQTACYSFPVFAVLSGITLFSILLPNTPCLSAVLRSVSSSQRTYAMAWYNLVARIFGTIPGPVLYGLVIDGACFQWQEHCGKRGTCWIYDNKHFSLGMFGLSFAMTGASAFFLLITLLTYRPKVTIAIPKESTDSESGSSSADETGDIKA
ncbi:solute carrier organic anion transporter family member 4C1-like [Lineus longissimus]|uniref:solute carrier organic anion transporter family member 4C1-like n=1 Tax=Lineus longissimus TaxID=88925 RepID=UPI00315C7595